MALVKIKSTIHAKNLVRIFTGLFILLFIVMNMIAIFHSYKLTHFTDSLTEKTNDPTKLTMTQKVTTLFFGVSNPRPVNHMSTPFGFETIILQGKQHIECWQSKTPDAQGTVILFHGFAGVKSGLLDKAKLFEQLGYNTLLVDFMGSGGSEGNCTTIGFREAEQVKLCYDYLGEQGEKNIYLFGTSMGAAAIMKALSEYALSPAAVVLECPFGSMYKTVCARFETFGIPAVPMAGLLVFWGGIQNGFWGFAHNPEQYAQQITAPVLLLYGARDNKVSDEEIRLIYDRLKGPKHLSIYPDAGHENYLRQYATEWTNDVEGFLTMY